MWLLRWFGFHGLLGDRLLVLPFYHRLLHTPAETYSAGHWFFSSMSTAIGPVGAGMGSWDNRRPALGHWVQYQLQRSDIHNPAVGRTALLELSIG
jgi:hypothetical protein